MHKNSSYSNYSVSNTTGIIKDLSLIEAFSYDDKQLKQLAEFRSKLLKIIDSTADGNTEKVINSFLELKYTIVENSAFLFTQSHKIQAIRDVFLGETPWLYIDIYIDLIDKFLEEYSEVVEEESIYSKIYSDELYEECRSYEIFETLVNNNDVNISHVCKILFLQESIIRGVNLQHVKKYTENSQKTFIKEKNQGFEYWDYRNISTTVDTKIAYNKRLEKNEISETSEISEELDISEELETSQTSKKSETKESVELKAFSLSGELSDSISQLGYITSYLKSGGKISMITGTGMGAVIGALICFGDEEEILERISVIQYELVHLLDIETSRIKSLFIKKNEKSTIKQCFIGLAGFVGISEGSNFSDCSIPFSGNVLNEYNGSSQSVQLGGSDNILDFITASLGYDGGEGNLDVDGAKLVKGGMNNVGTSIDLFRIMGIPESQWELHGSGYSSLIEGKVSQILNRKKHEKDFVSKLASQKKGAKIFTKNKSMQDVFLKPSISDSLQEGIDNFYQGVENKDKYFMDEINYVEEKYSLQVASQNIVGYAGLSVSGNGIKPIVKKQELLVRTLDEKTATSNLLKNIDKNCDNFGLFCFMLKRGFEIIKESSIQASVNVNVSDVMDTRFLDSLEIIKNTGGNDCPTLEILEGELIPSDKKLRKEFFRKLTEAREMGYKIFLDDIGGVSEEGDLLHANSKRIELFKEAGVLDGIKLDISFVRELYEYHCDGSSAISNLKRTLLLHDGQEIIFQIKELFGELKNNNSKFRIIAEGIDDYTDANAKEHKSTDIIRFLKDELGVDYFQGFGIAKPEIVEQKTNEN